MRCLVIYRSSSHEEGGAPDPQHMAEMGRLVEEMTARGVLLGTEPLAPRDACARVRLNEGQFTVSEENERGSGYAILQAGSKAEVIEHCKTFLKAAGDGVTEIRQIVEFAPQPA